MADQQPFIAIPNLSNFRSIGPYPTTNPSTTIRSDILYRSPDLSHLSTEGEQKLRDLGISTIFDLRSTPQIKRAGGVREVDGIKRVWCPIFEESEYTSEKAGLRYLQYSGDGTEGIVQAFLEILTHGAIPAFRLILRYFAGENPQPAIIHCTTGNNRSGAFIGGVLLNLLGVEKRVIAEEYALSQVGLEGEREEVVERLMRNPKFTEHLGTGVEGRRRAERMVGAREESMAALVEKVESKWGGAEGYMRDVVGLNGEEVERIRRVLTLRDGDA